MANRQIHSIWDNGGETADRYSIYLGGQFWPLNTVNGLRDCLAVNDTPTSPNMGFSQFCMGQPGPHNGRRIKFSELPLNVQKHVRRRLS